MKHKQAQLVPTAGGGISSTARAVMARMTAGSGFTEDKFVDLMIGSDILRQEPEFIDMYFPSRPTLEAATRHFSRFRGRLTRAMRRGGQELATIYDDYRIAALQDLDTPEFRRQLQQRLDQCTSRLLAGHDAKKIEVIIWVNALLGNKQARPPLKNAPPLGLYGLFTMVYEDSFDQAMIELADAQDLVDDLLYEMWCARRGEADRAIFTAALDRITTPDQFAGLVETDAALAGAWQRQKRLLLEEFQLLMARGALGAPTFFTPDEIALTMHKMEERHWRRSWSPGRHITTLAMTQFVQCIRETVDEIVSPARLAEITEQLRIEVQHALESKNKDQRALAPYLLGALVSLQEEKPPSQKPALTMLYLVNLTSQRFDMDELSPEWRRFLERLQKSQLWQMARESLDSAGEAADDLS
ncbi:MAG: hypothetical protein KJ734_12640 [Chloroflexi bacterium]|nr:hypothetical protein [Chloroflexota bacterium]